jgi:hypothetical protein
VSQTDGPGGLGEQDEPVGSVAEEAAKLVGAVSDWAREHGDGFSAFGDGLHEHLATGDASCSWCPVCRTVTAIRQTSPEVRAHLTSAASSLLLAVSGMLATHPPAQDPHVERIPVDDDWPEGDG